MLENLDVNSPRKQSSISITGLQCIIDVSHIIRYNDLSAGVYVSRYSIVAHLHELCRTIAFGTNTFCYRHTSIVSHVQKEFQVNIWSVCYFFFALCKFETVFKMLALLPVSFRLPDDIWLVDLDSNKLSPPTGSNEEIPPLPEPEGTILKNHLKQVTTLCFSVVTNSHFIIRFLSINVSLEFLKNS